LYNFVTIHAYPLNITMWITLPADEDYRSDIKMDKSAFTAQPSAGKGRRA